jgi:hypothetical protein
MNTWQEQEKWGHVQSCVDIKFANAVDLPASDSYRGKDEKEEAAITCETPVRPETGYPGDPRRPGSQPFSIEFYTYILLEDLRGGPYS